MERTKIEGMKMDELILEYSELATRKFDAMNREDVLRKDMNAICDKAARQFKKRINGLFQTSEAWTLYDVKGSAHIDHSKRPMEVSTTISVDVGYYREQQRGGFKLYGDLGKEDELFDELNRLINGRLAS